MWETTYSDSYYKANITLIAKSHEGSRRNLQANLYHKYKWKKSTKIINKLNSNT